MLAHPHQRLHCSSFRTGNFWWSPSGLGRLLTLTHRNSVNTETRPRVFTERRKYRNCTQKKPGTQAGRSEEMIETMREPRRGPPCLPQLDAEPIANANRLHQTSSLKTARPQTQKYAKSYMRAAALPDPQPQRTPARGRGRLAPCARERAAELVRSAP